MTLVKGPMGVDVGGGWFGLFDGQNTVDGREDEGTVGSIGKMLCDDTVARAGKVELF